MAVKQAGAPTSQPMMGHPQLTPLGMPPGIGAASVLLSSAEAMVTARARATNPASSSCLVIAAVVVDPAMMVVFSRDRDRSGCGEGVPSPQEDVRSSVTNTESLSLLTR